ncbi:RDD family protein [Embleya sp. NBC_00896]|uniref:RDD family protein n=1 Tax=Embleya sp. NBC_00896 TaxID=2975961 RepID=UPI00386573CE|nr:RDD family protein [Embleya sp. NBC_00896]
MTFPQPPQGPGSPYGDARAANGDPHLSWHQPPAPAPTLIPHQAPPTAQPSPVEGEPGDAGELPLASRTMRLVARTTDYLLTTALVLPLWFLAYHYIQAKATDLPTKVVRDAFLDVVFGRAGEAQRAPLEAVDGLWGTTKTLLFLLILAHLLVPTLYDWFMHARYGRTFGKIMVGAKVVPAGTPAAAVPGRVPVGAWRAGRRTLVAVVLPWAAVLLTWYEIALREWGLAGLFALVSLIGFLDPLAVLGPRRRTWHDRTAGTVVVNVKMLARGWSATRNASTAVVQGARGVRERWQSGRASAGRSGDPT